MKKYLLLIMCSVAILLLNTDSVFATNNIAISPRVIVSNYKVSGGGIVPGGEFELTLTFKNSSSEYDIHSLLITGSDPNGYIEPIYGGTNQQYIDEIPADGEIKVTFQLKASSRIEEDSVFFTINREFVDTVNGGHTNDVVIKLPVRQYSSLGIQGYNIPSNIVKGERTKLTVSYENTSGANLSDAMVIVTGSDIEEQSIAIGDIPAGKIGYKDIFVVFDKAVQQNVNIAISYSDIEGNTNEIKTNDYTVEVTDKKSKDSAQDEGSSNNNVILVVLGVLWIAVGIGIVVLMKQGKHKKKSNKKNVTNSRNIKRK